MRFLRFVLPTLALFGAFESAQACTASNVYLYSARFEAEGPMTVSSGKGCTFNINNIPGALEDVQICLLYTSPSPRDGLLSRMPSSA